MNTYHQHTEKAISVGWLIRCATAFLVVGAACVGYLHQKESLHRKAEEVEKLERELRLVKRENELKHQAYAAVVSPKYLEAEVRRRALDLVAPAPEDILSLPLPEPESVRSHAPSSAEANFDENALRRSSGLVMKRVHRTYMP